MLEKKCVDCDSSFEVDTSTSHQSWARKKYCEECKKQRRRVTQRRNFNGWYAKNKKLPSTPEQQELTREKIRQAALKQHEEGRVDKTGLSVGHSRTTEQRSSAWTPERRAAQAARTLQAYQEGRMTVHGCYKGIWTFYDGPKGQINMRSQSEAIFAQKLDQYDIDWQYEPQRFDLGWSTYCPDFHLPAQDTWVEVKGHLTELAARKMRDFQALGHRLVTVTYQQARAAGLPSELEEMTVR